MSYDWKSKFPRERYFETKRGILYHGDALEILKKFPRNSVDCIITSPPYHAQRVYPGAVKIWEDPANPHCEHEWTCELKERIRGSTAGAKVGSHKNQYQPIIISHGKFCKKCSSWMGELGMEPTLEMYFEHLLMITKELKRVLKPTGVMFWIHGDSRSGSNKGYGTIEPKYPKAKKAKDINPKAFVTKIPKRSLCLQNFRLAMKMVDEQRWCLMDAIVWAKKVWVAKDNTTIGNKYPEPVQDRCVFAYEIVFMFTKTQNYYSDFHSLKVPYSHPVNRWGGEILTPKTVSFWDKDTGHRMYRERSLRPSPFGANRPNVWLINTEQSTLPHFACAPEKLIEQLIIAGCPESVCRKCGKPRFKVIEKEELPIEECPPELIHAIKRAGANKQGEYHGLPIKDYPIFMQNPSSIKKSILKSMRKKEIVSYKECACQISDKFTNGIVLDPFMGSGTTAICAERLFRNWIGIEISQEYCELIKKRLLQLSLF